jgi:hypothetical protein
MDRQLKIHQLQMENIPTNQCKQPSTYEIAKHLFVLKDPNRRVIPGNPPPYTIVAFHIAVFTLNNKFFSYLTVDVVANFPG